MTETVQKENLKSSLNTFESVLKDSIEQAWSKTEEKEHLHALIQSVGKFAHQSIALGDYSMAQLENQTLPAELFPTYVIHFVWMEKVKTFLVLWRDIVFQYHKALILKSQGKVTPMALAELQASSHRVIEQSANELTESLENETRTMGMDAKTLEKSILVWSKQTSPWNIYKGQIEALNAQCEKIGELTTQLIKVSNEFQTIKDLVTQNLSACRTEIQQLSILAKDTIEYIEETVEEKPGKVSLHLEEMESKIETTNHIEILIDGIKETLDEMIEKIQPPVDTNGGLLLYQDFSFKRNTRQWLDSEVLPLVYELWEINEDVENSFKMSLLNIRNRALLLSNEMKEGKTPEFDQSQFCYPLVSYLQKTEKQKEKLQGIMKTIQSRIQKDFQLSEIYNTGDNFLPVPLQSTINQFNLNQNPWVVKSQQWLKKQRLNIEKFKSSVEHEETLSLSEKIVRFIEDRQPIETNEQYTGIFLTKGFVGKSFWVGREQELKRFEKLMEQWKLGFRGAAILSGQRFSGKTLFGEYTSNYFFYHKNVRLIPNAAIKVEGRIYNTTYDLGAALDFIKKHTINSQILVWIDDLEHWSEPNIPLSKNVRALCNAIDNQGDRMFLLVSMSNWLLSHLDKTHEILRVFQAEINLDNMNSDEIKKAILIRHGATHKTLLSSENEEPTPKEFQKMINKIHRSSAGNVGEALTQWANRIKKIDDENVSHIPNANFALPEFLTPDTALILATVMMEKRTNEYRLRKLFGSPFKEKYQHLIQRMISVGVLNRHLDGWLEINELAVNEIGKLLERKQYLKFNR